MDLLEILARGLRAYPVSCRKAMLATLKMQRADWKAGAKLGRSAHFCASTPLSHLGMTMACGTI